MLKPLIRVKGMHEHGLKAVLPNSVKQMPSGYSPKIKQEIMKEKEDNARLVKVRYLNHKRPHDGELTMPYTLGAGEQLQLWTFLSGEEYEVPYGLVKNVNGHKGKNVRAKEEGEKPDTTVVKREKIHEFMPIGF